jgi:hypothetical protein
VIQNSDETGNEEEWWVACFHTTRLRVTTDEESLKRYRKLIDYLFQMINCYIVWRTKMQNITIIVNV